MAVFKNLTVLLMVLSIVTVHIESIDFLNSHSNNNNNNKIDDLRKLYEYVPNTNVEYDYNYDQTAPNTNNNRPELKSSSWINSLRSIVQQEYNEDDRNVNALLKYLLSSYFKEVESKELGFKPSKNWNMNDNMMMKTKKDKQKTMKDFFAMRF